VSNSPESLTRQLPLEQLVEVSTTPNSYPVLSMCDGRHTVGQDLGV